MDLDVLLGKEKLSIKDLKQFINACFEKKKTLLNMDNVTLIYINSIMKPYGEIGANKKFKQFKIHVNLSKFINENVSNVKKLFNIYNNFVHEMEHAKTFEKTKEENFYDYEHLIILMEYLCYANTLNIDVKNKKINFIQKFLINRINKANYSISTSEIKSRLVSYKESVDLFLEHLNDEDLKIYTKIIESLQYLNNSIEIMYNMGKKPVNKFLVILVNCQQLLSKNTFVIQEYGILKNLFNDNGSIKNVYELYSNINDENKEMYDKLIINLLLTVKLNLSEYLSNEEFKKYIENLIGEYNRKVIYSYKNLDLGNVFVDDKKVFEANLKMQKQNVMVLNEISNIYGLNINSGMVLDYTLRKRIM